MPCNPVLTRNPRHLTGDATEAIHGDQGENQEHEETYAAGTARLGLGVFGILHHIVAIHDFYL
jgi:hypothetical protein